MSEENNEQEKKPKSALEIFIKDLKQFLELREKRKSLRRDIRIARRMPDRIKKLAGKLAAAKAAEAAESTDAHKAEVDRLEEALAAHKTIDWSLLEAESAGLRARCAERREVLQGVFVTLIHTGKINKKNADTVLSACRRAGLRYPGLCKRAWSRKWYR